MDIAEGPGVEGEDGCVDTEAVTRVAVDVDGVAMDVDRVPINVGGTAMDIDGGEDVSGTENVGGTGEDVGGTKVKGDEVPDEGVTSERSGILWLSSP